MKYKENNGMEKWDMENDFVVWNNRLDWVKKNFPERLKSYLDVTHKMIIMNREFSRKQGDNPDHYERDYAFKEGSEWSKLHQNTLQEDLNSKYCTHMTSVKSQTREEVVSEIMKKVDNNWEGWELEQVNLCYKNKNHE